jgi:hypothetical protein
VRAGHEPPPSERDPRREAERLPVGPPADPAAAPGAALEWSFNPWRERPLAAGLALGASLGGGLLLSALGVAPLGCLLLALAMGGSFAPLLVPARCRIDDQGVAQRGPFGWERRRWETIRRAARVRGGLLISPFARPRRLDAFRALLLPMPRADRRALTAQVAPRLARHGLEPIA